MWQCRHENVPPRHAIALRGSLTAFVMLGTLRHAKCGHGYCDRHGNIRSHLQDQRGLQDVVQPERHRNGNTRYRERVIFTEEEWRGPRDGLSRSACQRRHVHNCFTAYYAYFVVEVLMRHDQAMAKEFVQQFYGPIAHRHGTIYEKTNDKASMAHSWSIGFCEFL